MSYRCCVSSCCEHCRKEITQHSVTCPLTKDREDTVAGESVNACSTVEKCPVIPPSLVGTIEVEKFVIFGKLKLDPGGLRVAEAVPFCQHGTCLVSFLVDVEPTRRFRDQECAADDDAREEHLKPNGDLPRSGTADVEGTSYSTTSENTAGEPECIAVGSHDTTICRVDCLDNVDGPGSRSNGDTEAEKEATTHELMNAGICHGGTSDDRSKNDEQGTNEHAWSSSPGVNSGTDKRESTNASDLVHGRHQPSPYTIVGAVEVGQECFVGSETVEQASVEAIHGLTEESDQAAEHEQDHTRISELRTLLEEGFCVICISSNDLDCFLL